MPLVAIASLVWSGRLRPRNASSKIGAASFYHGLVLAVLSLAALSSWALAQRVEAPPRPSSPHFNLPTGSLAFGRAAHPSPRFRRSSPFTSLPFPFFGDSFNPEDIYSTGYPVASQPPVFLLQIAREVAGSPDLGPDNGREAPSTQPLMIELQGGRYVRVSSSAANGEALPLIPDLKSQSAKLTRRNSARRAGSDFNTQAPAIAAASRAPDLPPAVLMFRDGHSEEVRDYTIADGVLYARGDYYTDGYWNKKIELATLNLPETVKGNEVRGVRFILPSASNEVITRP